MLIEINTAFIRITLMHFPSLLDSFAFALRDTIEPKKNSSILKRILNFVTVISGVTTGSATFGLIGQSAKETARCSYIFCVNKIFKLSNVELIKMVYNPAFQTTEIKIAFYMATAGFSLFITSATLTNYLYPESTSQNKK